LFLVLLRSFLLVHVVAVVKAVEYYTPAEEEEEEEAPGRLVKIFGRHVRPLVDSPGGGGGWSSPPAAFQLHS
jgi:hypothetical protein